MQVLTEGDTIIGYTALLINDEPAYEKNRRKMAYEFSDLPYRVAISETHLRKLQIEEFCNKQTTSTPESRY
jgi:hypothetical protein